VKSVAPLVSCDTGLRNFKHNANNQCAAPGRDFVVETANGTEDIWWILEGKDYPRLWWEAAEQ
jgi:hypothetical protein